MHVCHKPWRCHSLNFNECSQSWKSKSKPPGARGIRIQKHTYRVPRTQHHVPYRVPHRVSPPQSPELSNTVDRCKRVYLDMALGMNTLRKSLAVGLRPYYAENTGSHPNPEVKLHQARLVLGWGTTLEPRVLQAFCFLLLAYGFRNLILGTYTNSESAVSILGSEIHRPRDFNGVLTAYLPEQSFKNQRLLTWTW